MNYKRIAIISYHTCPLADEKITEIGGMNIYILELSKELARSRHLVDIYTHQADKNSPKIVNVTKNLRVIHIPVDKLKNIRKFKANLDKFIREEKLTYDLINCHYYLSGLIGLNLKKKYQIPVTITFHTLGLMKNLVSQQETDPERISSEILLTKKADKVIATSDADAKYLLTLYHTSPTKLFILSPGINHELFKPIEKIQAKKTIGANPKHKLILFVGRIKPLKGLDVLLYALKILIHKNPDLKFCLWIVGGKKGVESERLKKIRKLLQISTFVKFVGEKRQEELPFYYNAAEMVIMPSQYESFGIAALEAMACGIPVIATDVTGVSDLFNEKQASLITSASNPILLAEKISNLLSDEAQRKKLSEEVLSKVKNLSWKKAAAKFEDMRI